MTSASDMRLMHPGGGSRRVRLESEFVDGLSEISSYFKKSADQLVAEINVRRERGQNLSTAIRLFVLEFYRRKNDRFAPSQFPFSHFSVENNLSWAAPSRMLRRESLRETQLLISLTEEIEDLYGKIMH